ncbi:MAG TPA: hypothetical protein VF003_11840 [Pseudonocardiaceae bacterium]
MDENEFRGGSLVLLLPGAGDFGKRELDHVDRDLSAGGVFSQAPIGLVPHVNRGLKDDESQDLQRSGAHHHSR